MLQVDHLTEVKELAEDGDWAIRIPTTVVIELEVVIDVLVEMMVVANNARW